MTITTDYLRTPDEWGQKEARFRLFPPRVERGWWGRWKNSLGVEIFRRWFPEDGDPEPHLEPRRPKLYEKDLAQTLTERKVARSRQLQGFLGNGRNVFAKEARSVGDELRYQGQDTLADRLDRLADRLETDKVNGYAPDEDESGRPLERLYSRVWDTAPVWRRGEGEDLFKTWAETRALGLAQDIENECDRAGHRPVAVELVMIAYTRRIR
jgi:hypothetical protein